MTPSAPTGWSALSSASHSFVARVASNYAMAVCSAPTTTAGEAECAAKVEGEMRSAVAPSMRLWVEG
jgi:hypothetical protein